MCNLDFNIEPLANQAIPYGMFTLLANRHIVPEDFLIGITNMSDLEDEILRCINTYNGEEPILQRVFHLIQIWGGMTGRYVYVKQPFEWQQIYAEYVQIVEACLNVYNCTSDIGIQSVYQSIINHRIPYVGVSFITKHVHFWLMKNNGLNALPIFDSRMSNIVLHMQQSFRNLCQYWHRMVDISNQEHIPVSVLERELFNGHRAL